MTSPNSGERSILFAAALFIVLCALVVAWPVGVAVVGLLPVPLVVFAAKGVRVGPPMMAALIAVLLYVRGFQWAALLIGLAAYFIGWTLGDVLKWRQRPYHALIWCTLVIVLLELVGLAALKNAGVDIYGEWRQAVVQALVDQGVSAADAQDFGAVMAQQFHLLTPALLCIQGFLLSVIQLVLGQWLLGPRAHATGWLLAFRLPASVAGVYVLTALLQLFSWQDIAPFWWQACSNASLIAEFFLGVQGLAWSWRLAARIASPAGQLWIRLLLLMVSPLPVINNLFVLAGLIDIMNGRKRFG
ncbi:hypothetical protein GCM10025857_21270 [Alicyclobacillus contaminans]|uniref:DUF2232 domain-containing protein n=1 Tax=Alicyclobacillus contaminans TaxID=392016 RepID=UPI000402B5FD|nr:DUF2232 domain-containing protein [Alicyclobacillus contaminans]GMA50770.1 hypothetical protein GCM10025857_21270 [Alicyclobacillus contaminans]